MKSKKAKAYDILKKSFQRRDKSDPLHKFFSGMEQYRSFNLYKTRRRDHPLLHFIYQVRYAAIIVVIGSLLSITASPFIYRKVIDIRYQNLLYREVTSGSIDQDNLFLVQSDNDSFVDYYLDIGISSMIDE